MNISKKVLMSSLIATMFVMALAITPTFGQAIPSIQVPIIIDTTYEPCTTFTIAIMVNDVEDLWGFEFTLEWQPDVLKCIGAFPVPPFTTIWPSEVGRGYVKLAASLPLGLQYGVSGTWVLVYMSFHVEAWGSTFLDLQDTFLTPWYAIPVIEHEAHDGFFANVEPKYNVDLKRAYPEHRNWIAAEDLDQTLTAVVRNFGSVKTDVKVTFTIMDEMGMWVHSQEITAVMHPRETLVVTKTIRFYDMPGYGTYYVTVEVEYHDVETCIWYPARHAKTYSFSLI